MTKSLVLGPHAGHTATQHSSTFSYLAEVKKCEEATQVLTYPTSKVKPLSTTLLVVWFAFHWMALRLSTENYEALVDLKSIRWMDSPSLHDWLHEVAFPRTHTYPCTHASLDLSGFSTMISHWNVKPVCFINCLLK